MKHPFVGLSVSFLVLALISIAPGCSSGSGAQRKDDAAATGGSVPPGSGGQVGSGGAVGTGGQPGSGGLLMTGGTVASGGIAATGGNVASGGTVTSGGTMGKGGVMATGGVSSGGAIGVGGTQAGGSSATGGKLATGGTLTTGGTVSAGGTIGTGGATGSGGVQGSGGNVGVGGARVDAGSTQGCQCTLNVVWSVPFDCYCADKPSDCEINYASYGPDAGASSRSYTGIKEYAGCNLAVVYDMDPMQDGNKYFDLTTGRLVGLTKTANGGINCPFGADAGALVFGLGTGQTTVPESCARTACFASSREPSYCTN